MYAYILFLSLRSYCSLSFILPFLKLSNMSGTAQVYIYVPSSLPNALNTSGKGILNMYVNFTSTQLHSFYYSMLDQLEHYIKKKKK